MREQACGGRESEAAGCSGCQVRPFSICDALTADELDELSELATHRPFRAKETIVAEGEPAPYVYNVTSGTVRLSKLLPDGRRQIVGFVLPGDFLGLAMADTSGFTADAVDHVAACRFARPAFSALVDLKPHLLRRLHAFAAHELSVAQEQMVLLGRRSADERLASFIMGLQARFARLGRATATVPLAMSRQDIADHLGLTIETVSRTFSRFVRDKALLVVPDGVRLLDAARLKALAAS